MNENTHPQDPRDTVQDLKMMVMNGALFGDMLKELSDRKMLDAVLADESMTDIEARVLMAAGEQFTRCIRNGMGLNQALLWMCNAGWPGKIGHQVLSRMGV